MKTAVMNIEQPAQKHVLHNLPDGALKGEKEKRNNVTRVTKRVTKRKNVSWISLFFWLNHRFFSSHFQILYSELRRPHLWWHHPSGPQGPMRPGIVPHYTCYLYDPDSSYLGCALLNLNWKGTLVWFVAFAPAGKLKISTQNLSDCKFYFSLKI